MIFTDKDLKWWRREHQSPMSQALLARLEAAEKVCESYWSEKDKPFLKRHGCCAHIPELEAWRKAAGK